MVRVFLSRPLPSAMLSPLAWVDQLEVSTAPGHVEPDVLLAHLRRVDGVMVTMTEHLSADVLSQANNLKVISQVGAGYDNIDVAAARDLGIVVLNTPAVTADATADLTWALILMVTRRIPMAMQDLAQGRWTTWDPWQWNGSDLQAQTLGILGLGQIGLGVAKRAAGFGVRTLYHSRNRRTEAEQEHSLEYCSFEDLVERADIISVHVSLNNETRRMLDARVFARMKNNAVIINTSRGEVVDEKDLLSALDEGQIGGVGLDVFSEEPVSSDNALIGHPKVVALPHIGSATVGTRKRMMATAIDNLAMALEGKPRNSTIVNGPF